eukprot:5707500-Pleurochrysis_carterae.AAC.1
MSHYQNHSLESSIVACRTLIASPFVSSLPILCISQYLDNYLNAFHTDHYVCRAKRRCATMCRVVRAFCPSDVLLHLQPTGVDALSFVPPLAANVNFDKMKGQLPAYLAAAAAAPSIGHDDINSFTADVLSFWQASNEPNGAVEMA